MQTERSIMKPTAELISIGNELLSGRTLNTHGRDLGAALSRLALISHVTPLLEMISISSNPLHKKHSNARPSYLSAAGSVLPSMISLVMPCRPIQLCHSTAHAHRQLSRRVVSKARSKTQRHRATPSTHSRRGYRPTQSHWSRSRPTN